MGACLSFLPKPSSSSSSSPSTSPSTLSQESRDALRHFVDELLQQEGINQALIPDGMERHLYMALLSRLVQMAQQYLHEQEWVLFHHRLSIRLEPWVTSPPRES